MRLRVEHNELIIETETAQDEHYFEQVFGFKAHPGHGGKHCYGPTPVASMRGDHYSEKPWEIRLKKQSGYPSGLHCFFGDHRELNECGDGGDGS